MDKKTTLPKNTDLENVESGIYPTNENKSNEPIFSLELTIKANEYVQSHLSVS